MKIVVALAPFVFMLSSIDVAVVIANTPQTAPEQPQQPPQHRGGNRR